MLRSNKYKQYSDERILELCGHDLKGESLFYLQQELELRGLDVKAKMRRKSLKRGKDKPATLIRVFVVSVLVLFFAVRLLPKLLDVWFK